MRRSFSIMLVMAAALTLGGVMVAGSAWRAMARAPVLSRAVPPPAGYEAEDHFPGARPTLPRRCPRPAAGSASTGNDGHGSRSRPCPCPAWRRRWRRARRSSPRGPSCWRAPASTARAPLQCLADAIYYEAASEPDAGQRAVAQVVLNRVRHPAFPGTVCGVVYQGSERGGCQFSFACDGAMARIPSRVAMARATNVAAAALAGYVYAPVGLATHYHTYAVTPAWNRTLVMTDAVGAHFFHRWKGWWGTAAAFTQVYHGNEPPPGAHPSMAGAVAAGGRRIRAGRAAGHSPAGSGAIRVSRRRPSRRMTVCPPPSQVLDRWKDSGKPLGS